jgi:hypothetical protein
MQRRVKSFKGSWMRLERLSWRLDVTSRKKVQANQEKMRRISEKKKLEHKDNERFNYEHLCNVEILKS